MTIVLNDFRNWFLQYKLDTVSGDFAVQQVTNPMILNQSTQGYASRRMIGILKPTSSLIAFYSEERVLALRIGGNVFSFSDKSLEARWSHPAPFMRRFVIERPGRIEIDIRYWSFEWREWPDNGDIFTYIAHSTSTLQERLRTAYLWDAHGKGFNITSREVLTGMEEWVNGELGD